MQIYRRIWGVLSIVVSGLFLACLWELILFVESCSDAFPRVFAMFGSHSSEEAARSSGCNGNTVVGMQCSTASGRTARRRPAPRSSAEPPGACPRPALPDGGTTRASPCLRPHVMRECVHARVYSLSRTRVCGRCVVVRRSAESVPWRFSLRLRDFACEKVLALVSKENVAVRGWKRCSRGITLWDNACCCSKRRGYHPSG